MKHRTKHLLIFILLLCLPLTIGAKIFDVELRGTDKDHPLVNLEAIIKLGGQYASGQSDVNAENAKDREKDASNASTDNKTGGKTSPAKEDPKPTRVVVRINNKTIFVNGKMVGRAIFERTFQAAYAPGLGAELQDDYAEYQTYMDIKRYFEENKISYIQTTLE